MKKIKDCNLVCTNLNNRCHLTNVERTGSIVSVFLGKADFLCADPRMYINVLFSALVREASNSTHSFLLFANSLKTEAHL